MNISEFSKASKGNHKIINEISNMYISDCINDLATKYNVNKTAAKYLLAKALTFYVVKGEIEGQLEFLDENELVFEDDN